jgi:hypothetical protein
MILSTALTTLLTGASVPPEPIVILPVVATGKHRAHWKTAAALEKTLGKIFSGRGGVATAAVANKADATLGRQVMLCEGDPGCLAKVVGMSGRRYGLAATVIGRGRRAKVFALLVSAADGEIGRWKGGWKGSNKGIVNLLEGALKRVKAESAPVEEPPNEELGLAVMDLANEGGFTDQQINLIQGNVLGTLQKSGRFDSMISGDDVREMLNLEQQKSAMGCADESCLADIGGALGVPYMITMKLGRFTDQFVFNLTLIAVDDAKVLHRISQVLPNQPAVLAYMPEIIEEVLTGAFGKVATPLVNDAAAVAAVQAEVERVRLAKMRQPIYARPLLWVGVSIGAVGGVLYAVTPTDRELQTKRQRYDELGDATSWDNFEGAKDLRTTASWVLPTLLGLGATAVIGAVAQ